MFKQLELTNIQSEDELHRSTQVVNNEHCHLHVDDTERALGDWQLNWRRERPVAVAACLGGNWLTSAAAADVRTTRGCYNSITSPRQPSGVLN
ncbi:hypothetical protein J6590_034446 [Homalodisca vitripennis]|nr:hypothetical protein J6590_034446 [Homalodisca vitripennis]